MATTSNADFRIYALAGAKARLADIHAEAASIRRAFPELREGVNGSTASATMTAEDQTASASPRSGRRTMSAAQRKAVGERMKKYWAARRGGSVATGTSSPDSGEKVSKTARGVAKRGPRTISPEARKRISDAQKARWAKQRGGAKAADSSPTSETSNAKGRRTAKRIVKGAPKRGPRKVSAAARKRMSQAQKKRWAVKRKAA